MSPLSISPTSTHPQGRAVLWAGMQERDRPAGAHDHACCLSAPRCLWLAPGGGRLWQEPLPELAELRGRSPGGAWSWRPAGAADGAAGEALRVAPALKKAHLDIELAVERGAGGGGAFALVLHPTAGGGEGAAVVFAWGSDVLQVRAGALWGPVFYWGAWVLDCSLGRVCYGGEHLFHPHCRCSDCRCALVRLCCAVSQHPAPPLAFVNPPPHPRRKPTLAPTCAGGPLHRPGRHRRRGARAVSAPPPPLRLP